MSIAVTTTKKELKSCIGLIKNYRDIWQNRFEVLAPLSSMTSRQAK